MSIMITNRPITPIEIKRARLGGAVSVVLVSSASCGSVELTVAVFTIGETSEECGVDSPVLTSGRFLESVVGCNHGNPDIADVIIFQAAGRLSSQLLCSSKRKHK